MNKFKSPWFFWYTGHKSIALLSMAVSTVILWIFLVLGAGFSIWGIITAVLLDAVGFWLAVIYLFVLRGYVESANSQVGDLSYHLIPDLHLQDKADSFVLSYFVIPLMVGFFVSRISSYFVAKMCDYEHK